MGCGNNNLDTSRQVYTRPLAAEVIPTILGVPPGTTIQNATEILSAQSASGIFDTFLVRFRRIAVPRATLADSRIWDVEYRFEQDTLSGVAMTSQISRPWYEVANRYQVIKTQLTKSLSSPTYDTAQVSRKDTVIFNGLGRFPGKLRSVWSSASGKYSELTIERDLLIFRVDYDTLKDYE